MSVKVKVKVKVEEGYRGAEVEEGRRGGVLRRRWEIGDGIWGGREREGGGML